MSTLQCSSNTNKLHACKLINFGLHSINTYFESRSNPIVSLWSFPKSNSFSISSPLVKDSRQTSSSSFILNIIICINSIICNNPHIIAKEGLAFRMAVLRVKPEGQPKEKLCKDTLLFSSLKKNINSKLYIDHVQTKFYTIIQFYYRLSQTYV